MIVNLKPMFELKTFCWYISLSTPEDFPPFQCYYCNLDFLTKGRLCIFWLLGVCVWRAGGGGGGDLIPEQYCHHSSHGSIVLSILTIFYQPVESVRPSAR